MAPARERAFDLGSGACAIIEPAGWVSLPKGAADGAPAGREWKPSALCRAMVAGLFMPAGEGICG